MKMDKTGACTVIAAIATVARLAPGTPLLAVAPAVENMPGPHSARPGDVVTALNGKTVDITNTDAEGRLILGDAMTYAERHGATHLVDVATLTGAVSRALGHLVTGAFGTPQDWYDEVAAAGVRAGERYWQLPLVDEYVADMDSWYADFQNSGSAEGSLVKSGLFLREFATVPWVHLDIAGTAYYRKATPFAPRGATGVVARHARGTGPGRRQGELTASFRPSPPDAMEPLSVAPGRVRRGAGWRRRPVRDALAGARRGASRRPRRSIGGRRSASSWARSRSGCCRCRSAGTRSRWSCSGRGS